MSEASMEASYLNIFLSGTERSSCTLFRSTVTVPGPSRGAGTHHIPAPRMAHERH